MADELTAESRQRHLELHPFLDLCLESADKSIGHGRIESAGAKRVPPLRVGQLRQMLTGPPHIVRRDPFGEQLLMPSVIVELHQAVADARDEAETIEQIGIALAGIELRGLAERAADVADDIPPQRASRGGTIS